VAYKTHAASGCAALPVSFKSFTASRNHSNVMLKWETSFEQNSSGFAVERNISGTWQQIAFVASQAPGGNSSDLLSYQYMDVNNTKGISQYRIRQEGFDNQSSYTNIIAVRSETQADKTIVYPNPSDGTIQVLFENGDISRDILLTDMSGRNLKQWKNVTANNLEIANLNSGLYILRVVNIKTKEQVALKIIVNK